MQGVFSIINFGDRAHASGATLEAFESLLRERGAPYRLERSRSIAHCYDLIREAWDAGFRTLLIGGGDGTLNVALNHPLASRFTLGVLPLGTVNALARTLGLDAAQPVEALRRVLAAPARPCCVGRLADRRFLCFASVGYDARVTHDAGVGVLKRVLGRGAFGLAATWGAARLDALPRFAYRLDKNPATDARANQLAVSNIACYAGLNLFETTVEKPFFQGYSMDARSPLTLARVGAAALNGPPMKWTRGIPRVVGLTEFRRVDIAARRSLDVQIDGEPIRLPDARRFRIETEPEPQRFLVPTTRGR